MEHHPTINLDCRSQNSTPSSSCRLLCSPTFLSDVTVAKTLSAGLFMLRDFYLTPLRRKLPMPAVVFLEPSRVSGWLRWMSEGVRSDRGTGSCCLALCTWIVLKTLFSCKLDLFPPFSCWLSLQGKQCAVLCACRKCADLSFGVRVVPDSAWAQGLLRSSPPHPGTISVSGQAIVRRSHQTWGLSGLFLCLFRFFFSNIKIVVGFFLWEMIRVYYKGLR